MEQPLVSIVTITRNRGNLLKRCISSVLSQTYENIEHIVVDGASDDNTDDVVATFDDERLKFVKLDYNWPLKKTIDYGVSLCSGKYITFLDSDDEYLPVKVEKQVQLFENLSDDYGFIYCWMTYYDSSKDNEFMYVHNPQLRGFVCDEVIGEPIISGTPTLMFRTDFFRKFGGWKSVEEIGIASDWEMCARACQLCMVDYVAESLVNVYVNHGSVRQSDAGGKYYNSFYERSIKYHKHFLTFFSDNFDRRKDLKVFHYYSIASNYIKLKKYFKFTKYFFYALCSNPKVIINKITKKIA